MQSKTSETAGENAELDPQALAAIRDLLHSEATPEPAATEPERKVARAQQPNDAPRKMPLDGQPMDTPSLDKRKKGSKRAKAKAAGGGILGDVKQAVFAYRPTPKHIILASLALLVFFRPWLVVGLLFLGLFVVLGVFLILGYDGFWRRAMAVGRWYAQRRPERAVVLHRRLDSFAMRWDAILDRFPEGSVDGLYLPDFGDLATADARHEDALDRRFANMRENEA